MKILKMGCHLLAKFITFGILGLQVENAERFPTSGPAILVANHNSHLDTLVLMSLFSFSMVDTVRPVANERYFLHQHPWLTWFSTHVLNIIPVACETRSPQAKPSRCQHRTFLKRCAEALSNHEILIVYPEGSRGVPEHLGTFKDGITHLAKRHPEVPVVPVFLYGLGKALPKGDFLLVPFLCSATIGLPLSWRDRGKDFLHSLTAQMQTMALPHTQCRELAHKHVALEEVALLALLVGGCRLRGCLKTREGCR